MRAIKCGVCHACSTPFSPGKDIECVNGKVYHYRCFYGVEFAR